MSEMTRAAFCSGPGQIEIRKRPFPTVAAGEALIRVRACGICGSDLHWFHGGFPPPPVCPGHEIAGEVISTGADVHSVRAGDRVVVEPLVVCGSCFACRTGDYQLCRQLKLLGTMRDGGFADHVTVPASALFPLPPGLPFDVGALTEPTAVCVHAFRLAGLRAGHRVLVLGAGTIGLLSVFVARASGATEVAITSRYPHQGAMARRLGATHVFSAGETGAEQLRGRGVDHPVDVVIETVGGTAATLDDAIHFVRPGGTVVVLGIFTAQPRCNALALVVKEIRLLGSMTYGRSGARADFDVALDLLSAHADLVRGLITHRFGLDAIQQAFAAAGTKHDGAIKVTVVPDGAPSVEQIDGGGRG